MPGRVLALAFLLLCATSAAYEEGEADPKFKLRVRPLIRDYIFNNYKKFGASELTFRDLKEHVAAELGMTYEMLKADHLSCALAPPFSHFSFLFCLRQKTHSRHSMTCVCVMHFTFFSRSLAIEDETDDVTNTCEAGDMAIDACKQAIGYEEGGAASSYKDET